MGLAATHNPARRVPERPNSPMRIALYQPDIPQNTGTILRMCACLSIEAHLIGPAGFPTSDRAFRRAGMDYLDAVTLVRHAAWDDFERWRRSGHHRQLRELPDAAEDQVVELGGPEDGPGQPGLDHDALAVELRAGVSKVSRSTPTIET